MIKLVVEIAYTRTVLWWRVFVEMLKQFKAWV